MEPVRFHADVLNQGDFLLKSTNTLLWTAILMTLTTIGISATQHLLIPQNINPHGLQIVIQTSVLITMMGGHLLPLFICRARHSGITGWGGLGLWALTAIGGTTLVLHMTENSLPLQTDPFWSLIGVVTLGTVLMTLLPAPKSRRNTHITTTQKDRAEQDKMFEEKLKTVFKTKSR